MFGSLTIEFAQAFDVKCFSDTYQPAI